MNNQNWIQYIFVINIVNYKKYVKTTNLKYTLK